MVGRAGDEIWVTGLGMICSLGYDAPTACAASRANLLRASESETFVVADPASMSGAPAAVHAVPNVTRGFEGDARLLRLLHAGLSDLRARASDEVLREAQFYLSLPDPRRIHTGFARMADGKRLESERVVSLMDPPEAPLLPAGRLLRRALRLAEWPGATTSGAPVKLRALSTTGTSGVHEVLDTAVADLVTNTVRAAVVGGVDSLLDPSTLQWVQDTCRLKTPDRPAGMMPGEAAAFLLLERANDVRPRRKPGLLAIAGLAFGRDTEPLLSGRTSTGRALAEAIFTIAPQAGWSRPRDMWLVADQNGEEYRASEWGTTLTHLKTRFGPSAEPTVWNPAASFGDCGAAFGAVAACVVAASFARRYAAHNVAMIACSAETGVRAVGAFSAPPGAM